MASDPRQRAAETKRFRTREASIAAAAKLIERDGADVRLDDVAAEAGISVATVFNVFRTKTTMFEDVAYEVLGNPPNDVLAIPVPESLEEAQASRLRFAKTLAYGVNAHPGLARLALATHVRGESESEFRLIPLLVSHLIDSRFPNENVDPLREDQARLIEVAVIGLIWAVVLRDYRKLRSDGATAVWFEWSCQAAGL